jgi:hypothetical protein
MAPTELSANVLPPYAIVTAARPPGIASHVTHWQPGLQVPGDRPAGGPRSRSRMARENPGKAPGRSEVSSRQMFRGLVLRARSASAATDAEWPWSDRAQRAGKARSQTLLGRAGVFRSFS